MTTRINYDHELTLLNDDIKQMGFMVESSIEQCFIAFEDQDFEKAEGIIRGDRTINDLERSIEARRLSLIPPPAAGGRRSAGRVQCLKGGHGLRAYRRPCLRYRGTCPANPWRTRLPCGASHTGNGHGCPRNGEKRHRRLYHSGY